MRRRTHLIAGDVSLSVLAVWSGHALLGQKIGTPRDLVQVVLIGSVILFSSFMTELYNTNKFMPVRERFARIVLALLITLLLLSSLFYIVPTLMLERRLLLASIAVFGALQFFWHQGYMSTSSAPGFARRVLILGTGPLALKMSEVISSANSRHTVAGYVALEDTPPQVPAGSILGTSKNLCTIVKRERIQRLVVSLSERRGVFPLQDVLNCKFDGVDVLDAPSFYEDITGKLLIENITPSWFIFCGELKLTQPKRAAKRLFDIAAALVGCILAAPLAPFIALLIKLDSKGPVLFRQVRMGEQGKLFTLYKFRTMRQDAEKSSGAVWAQQDDPRVTRIGRFLRTSRLDELPQLFNILRGDMSLIGPRPERPEFIEGLSKIIPFYSQRHAVKPGLTGWAQIRYPYGSSVDDAIEKLRYDLFYIKHMSMLFDIGIILETIKVILFGRGAR
ncbi:MAG: TIGR03013 family XrtA/PEP-CTERM system glycosyltransferase [Nitrospirota bacterium]